MINYYQQRRRIRRSRLLKLIDYICAAIICVLFTAMITVITVQFITRGTIIEDTTDFYIFNDLRINKSAMYNVIPVFYETGELECYYIRFIYQGDIITIECIDENGATAEQWKDSYLRPFKEESNGLGA